jgi:universal stress protein A
MKAQAQMFPWRLTGLGNILARLLPASAGTADLDHNRPDFWPGFTWKSDEPRDGARWSNMAWGRQLNLLVPIDFTVSSLPVLSWAFKLARRQMADVTLLHAIYINLTPYGPANLAFIKEEMRDVALARISRILDVAKQANVTFNYAIQEGEPSAVIEDYIRQHDVDLVILAPHKRHGLDRFLRSKTAETVIRRADCPVLIVNH